MRIIAVVTDETLLVREYERIWFSSLAIALLTRHFVRLFAPPHLDLSFFSFSLGLSVPVLR